MTNDATTSQNSSPLDRSTRDAFREALESLLGEVEGLSLAPETPPASVETVGTGLVSAASAPPLSPIFNSVPPKELVSEPIVAASAIPLPEGDHSGDFCFMEETTPESTIASVPAVLTIVHPSLPVSEAGRAGNSIALVVQSSEVAGCRPEPVDSTLESRAASVRCAPASVARLSKVETPQVEWNEPPAPAGDTASGFSGSEPPPLEREFGGPVLPPQELSDEPWEIEDRPPWFQRWFRGWRLILILVLLAGGYVMWRGGRDYQSFKQWRARSLAEEALEKSGNGDFAAARSLLDQAAILSPIDPVVMRAMADFCEPRRDPMALYALRQLALSGKAELADWERLCRLAFEWGHQELAPARLLNHWAAVRDDLLTLEQLKLSSRWMAMRGQRAAAERRLRNALEHTPHEPELELALCVLLLGQTMDSLDTSARAEDALDRLARLSTDSRVSIANRTEAARLMATVLLPKSNRALLTESRTSQLKEAFEKLAAECGPSAALSHRLAAASVDLAAYPSTQGDTLREVLSKSFTLTPKDRLTVARWLNDNGFFQDTLTICDRTEESAGDAEWFTVRLDAMFALKDFSGAQQRLLAEGQPLPSVTQQLFLYRIARASGGGAATVKSRRRELEDAARSGNAVDVFKAAENAERFEDPELAITLFHLVENDEGAGLSARLGIVRCLDSNTGRTSELQQALESVLHLWPQFDDARSDLIYLRLLNGETGDEDLKTIMDLVERSPWFVAYRVTAALGELQHDRAASAMVLLERDKVPWEKARKGWQAVYAATLAANGRMDEARAIAVRLRGEHLRPGEQRLVKRFISDAP